MAVQVARRYCRICKSKTKAERPGCNHLAHAVITLFLFGLWLPVWVLRAWVFTGKFRCSHCGGKV